MYYSYSLCLGVAILALSIYLLYKNTIFIKNNEKAFGEVVALDKIYRKTNKPTYKPIFEFKTKTGEIIQYTSISSSNPPSWKIGEKATYIYNINNPKKGKILTFYNVFGFALFLFCIATLLIIISGAYFLTKPLIETVNNII